MTAQSTTGGSDPRVVLHIGLPGAGGPYLRSVLDAHREAVAAAGVGAFPADDAAVADALAPRREAAESTGAWQRLVADVDAAGEPVRLVSAELLSTAPDNAARAVVAAFAPRRVEVVVTAQDMARTIPSAWQHAVAHGRKITFTEYAQAAVGAANDRPTREQLSKQHDLVAILERWSALVGAANVHLVTVPPPGAAPTAFWERFAGLLGLAGVVPVESVGPYLDGDLAFSEAELLRRLNRRVGNEMAPPNYDRYVRDFLAEEVMRPLGQAAAYDRPALDPKGMQWAATRGTQIAAEVASLNVDVVGDLSDLVPATVTEVSAGGHPGPAPVATYPDTAVRAVAMLVRKLVEIDPTSAPTPAKSGQQRRRLRAAGRNPRRAGS